MTRIEKDIKKIKDQILGKRYELSFAFIDKKEIKELNKKYRGKNEPTDILSFPYSKNSGEILICKKIANKKFKENRLLLPSYLLLATDYLLFLVIHGCLHLKGFNHGDKMKTYERTYYSWYRCWHIRSASGGCRKKF
jgi:rRNA maturation RNase YbeY